MLALARLQRKFRLLESPYRTPQTLVGGPRADAALMALSGRTATTKAMGKGSTQFQHQVQTEVPPKLLEEWLDDLAQAPRRCAGKLKVSLRPHSAGSQLLELSRPAPTGDEGRERRLRHRSRTGAGGASSRSATRTRSTRACAASG